MLNAYILSESCNKKWILKKKGLKILKRKNSNAFIYYMSTLSLLQVAACKDTGLEFFEQMLENVS